MSELELEENSMLVKRRRKNDATTFTQTPKGKKQGSTSNSPSNDSAEADEALQSPQTKGVAMSNAENESDVTSQEEAAAPVALDFAGGDTEGEEVTKTAGGGGGASKHKLSQVEERLLISLLYRRFGAPPPENWDGEDGAITKIVSAINYTTSQRRKVKEVVERTYQSLMAGEQYDPKKKPRDETCNHAIKEGSQVYQLVADYMTTGMSYTDMTTSINDILLSVGEPTVTRSAVYSCAQRMIKKVTASGNL